MLYIYRRTLSSCRCSYYSLAIETGRHDNIEKMFWLCTYCLNRNTYIIEDELHFVLICPLYDNLRKRYFPQHWNNNLPTKHLFNTIMQCQNKTLFHILARYLKWAFEERQSYLKTSSSSWYIRLLQMNKSFKKKILNCIN